MFMGHFRTWVTFGLLMQHMTRMKHTMPTTARVMVMVPNTKLHLPVSKMEPKDSPFQQNMNTLVMGRDVTAFPSDLHPKKENESLFTHLNVISSFSPEINEDKPEFCEMPGPILIGSEKGSSAKLLPW